MPPDSWRFLCLSDLRHPRGGSFVRPSKVSFGVDYLTAVQQAYQTDVEEVLSEASSNNVDLRLKELRYGARCPVSSQRRPAVGLVESLPVTVFLLQHSTTN